jgi:hypothetical protein
MRFIYILKQKWGIQSNLDFILIMTVFSLAGMSISWMRRPVFHWIGISETTPLWIKVLVYIPLIVPLYQLNLLVFGTLLGQFSFFWEKEKKMGRFFISLITGKKRPRQNIKKGGQFDEGESHSNNQGTGRVYSNP